MKINLEEFENSFWFGLHPETIEDAAQLLRLANTVKREPLTIHTDFNENIVCNFELNKKFYSCYSNTLNNRGKK